MASKLKSDPRTIADDVAVSAATQFETLDVGKYSNGYSFHIVWDTGVTLSMTLNLQVSLNGITWETVQTQAISGATGSHFWDIANTNVSKARITISGVTGSGNFSVYSHGREWY